MSLHHPWLFAAVVIGYVVLAQSMLGEALGRIGRLTVAGVALVLVVGVEVWSARKASDGED